MLDFLLVAAIGILVGVAELVPRYRDDPGRALLSNAAILYLTINGAAAALALLLARLFGWTYGASEPTAIRWMQVIVSGFAAMVIFRSSLLRVPVGDAEAPVGPALILQALLDAADRGVDRSRGIARAGIVGPLMDGIVFAKAAAPLPAMCISLMQNMSETDQEKLGQELQRISALTLTDEVKSRLLGIQLLNYFGEEVVRSAIKSLGVTIR